MGDRIAARCAYDDPDSGVAADGDERLSVRTAVSAQAGPGTFGGIVEAHDWTVGVDAAATGGARFEIDGVEFVDGSPRPL